MAQTAGKAPDHFPPLHRAGAVSTLQCNLGRLCNQACHHCHVEASPAHGGPEDNAGVLLIDQILELLEHEPGLRSLDLTGGAPELNPGFRRLVRGARTLGREVLVRHNLTVQEEPGQADLPAFFAEQGVVLYCSLPCYLEENVDGQRGRGVYEKSIRALRLLNSVGFGRRPELALNLVYNPIGPQLPPPQAALEEDYRRELRERAGIRFTRLVTITNQAIHRFRDALERSGELEDYQALLRRSFNPATLPGLMCRSALSVRWDGRLYDCDFNLVLDLPLRRPEGSPWTLEELLADPRRLGVLSEAAVVTAEHCFACTAGCGSSCGGALATEADAEAA